MSNFIPVESRFGVQPIGQSNAKAPSTFQVGQSPSYAQEHPLGTIIRAYDSTLGEGEFIYLQGVGSTLVGSLVQWNNQVTPPTTTLAASTAALNGPLAVSMSANVLSQWGWYQVAGIAVIRKGAVKISPSSRLFVSASGTVSSASVAGKQVFNAISVNTATVASATSTIQASIMRPFMEPIATP
jgi:hypothetical protein